MLYFGSHVVALRCSHNGHLSEPDRAGNEQPEAEHYACSVAFAEVRYVISMMEDWGLTARCIHGTDSSSAIVHASRLG